MKQRKIILTALLLAFLIVATYATTPTDTLYNNHSVSERVRLIVDGSINAQSDTVTSTGHLTLVAQQGVSLLNNIDVQLGGTLVIMTGTIPCVRYTYDACGNRVRREKEPQ